MAEVPPPILCSFCDQPLGLEHDRRGVSGNHGAICWDCLELNLCIVKASDLSAFEGIIKRAAEADVSLLRDPLS